MTNQHTNKLRALLLASIMVLSVVAGSLAFAGGVAAEGQYDLEATDGAGGNESTLFTNFTKQLPEGSQSGNDTLRVEANNDPLPQDFIGNLHLGEGELTFSEQNESSIELVVIGSSGSEVSASSSDNIRVSNVSDKRVEFEVSYEQTDLFGNEEDPVAVEVRSLTFDAGSSENVTLTWEIPNQKADYNLRVKAFDAELEATDEHGGAGSYVTAGAENQPMIGPEYGTPNDPAEHLVLRGHEDEFPSSFNATITLESENVTFHSDLSSSDVEATSTNSEAEVTVTNVSRNRIEVSVSSFNGDRTDVEILNLSGVTYDVPPNADEYNVTWEIRGQTASYLIVPERLDASFNSDYQLTRGLNQTGSASFEIDGMSKHASGFHNSSEDIVVRIPEDDLLFDTTADVSATVESGGTLLSSDASVTVNNRTLNISVDQDIGNEETINVTNVRFNTTGFDATAAADDETAEFTSGLKVEHTPVNSGFFEPVTVETDDSVAVKTPNVAVRGAPTYIPSGETSTTGTSGIEVRIDDTAGHQMANGTDIVIGLEDAQGVSFNTSQEDALQLNGSAGFTTAVRYTVSEKSITISIADFADASQEGEYVRLEHENEPGLLFNTTGAADGANANLTVTTNGGDAPVTQVTGEVVSVDDPEIALEQGTIALANNQTVAVTATDVEGKPVSGVDISAESDAFGINRSTTTGENGNATFSFDLSDAESAHQINFSATVDGVETEATVHTVDLETDRKIPASADTQDIHVEVLASDKDAKGNVDVFAESSDFDVSSVEETGSDGIATFPVTADGAGDIGFNATVEGVDLETSVEAVPPTIDASPANIPLNENTTVSVNVTALENAGDNVEPTGQDNITVNVSSEEYNESAVVDATENETDSNGVATFEINLTNVTDPGEFEFNATADGIEINDTVVATGAEMESDRDTVALADGETVTIEVLNASDEPATNVDVTAGSETLDVNQTVNTGDDGNATFTFNLSEEEDVGEIEFTATVDESTLSQTIDTASIQTNVSDISAGDATPVEVAVESSATGAEQDVDVFAKSDDFDVQDNRSTTDDNGTAAFTFEPGADGTIDINAAVGDAELETSVTSVAPTISVDPATISAGENSTVNVTVEALSEPDGEMEGQSGVNVSAASDDYEIDASNDTDDAGVATFTFNLSDETEGGTIEFNATINDFELNDTVTVQSDDTDGDTGDGDTGDGDTGDGDTGDGDTGDGDTGDGDTGDGDNSSPPAGGGGGGGGGGGAAAAPSPSPNITVTNVSLSTTQIETNETLDVTTTVENTGDADGEYTVRIRSNGMTIATETVNVSVDETVTVTKTISFDTGGEREITVDGVTGGTVIVEGGEEETTATPTQPEVEPPAGAVAFDAQPVVDATPEEEGIRVEFENTTVDAITFSEGADGQATVAELDSLPEGVGSPPGETLRAMNITVPEQLSDQSATIRFTVTEEQLEATNHDPEDIRLGHYTDGGWDIHQPELVEQSNGEYVYEAETNGFSPFAVFAQDSEETATQTSTTTETESEPVSEEAGLLNSTAVIFGLVSVIAIMVAIVGARVSQRNNQL